MKIKQKSVHSNGFSVTRTHANTNSYSNANSYSRSNWYSDYGRSGHSNNTCYWGDACGWSGAWHARDSYSRHNSYGDSGSYSRGSGYSQSYRTTDSNYRAINTVNWSPKVSGAILSAANYGSSNTISLDVTSITYTDTESHSRSAWRLYYRYRNTPTGSWGNWTYVTEQTGTSYNWNISQLPAGYYEIAITVKDTGSWSALLSGNTWIADHQETCVSSTTTQPPNNASITVVTRQDTTAYDTISYATATNITIFRYVPPASWPENQWLVDTMTTMQEEVDKARVAFGLQEYSFTNKPVIANFTWVTVSDMEELVTATNEVATKAGKTNITNSASTNEFVSDETIKKVQSLLNKLGE